MRCDRHLAAAAGLRGDHGRDRRQRAAAGPGSVVRPGRARRDDARAGRVRDRAPAAPGRQPGPGDLPDRQGHPGGQDRRPDYRRRRLHDQAVRARGARGPGADRAAPHPPGRGRRAGADVRGHRARPGQLRGPPRRPPDRAVPDRVPPAALPDAQPGPGADPGPAPGPRLGLRLRRLQHGRRHLRRVPAAQACSARAGSDPHPARRRLRPAAPPAQRPGGRLR